MFFWGGGRGTLTPSQRPSADQCAQGSPTESLGGTTGARGTSENHPCSLSRILFDIFYPFG